MQRIEEAFQAVRIATDAKIKLQKLQDLGYDIEWLLPKGYKQGSDNKVSKAIQKAWKAYENIDAGAGATGTGLLSSQSSTEQMRIGAEVILNILEEELGKINIDINTKCYEGLQNSCSGTSKAYAEMNKEADMKIFADIQKSMDHPYSGVETDNQTRKDIKQVADKKCDLDDDDLDGMWVYDINKRKTHRDMMSRVHVVGVKRDNSKEHKIEVLKKFLKEEHFSWAYKPWAIYTPLDFACKMIDYGLNSQSNEPRKIIKTLKILNDIASRPYTNGDIWIDVDVENNYFEKQEYRFLTCELDYDTVLRNSKSITKILDQFKAQEPGFYILVYNKERVIFDENN